MEEISIKIVANIEITNLDLISKLNILSQELSLPIEELILEAINKLVVDIEFVRKLRH